MPWRSDDAVPAWRSFAARRLRRALLALLAVPALAAAPEATGELRRLPDATAPGDYAVGTLTAFAVDHRQRFDPWNGVYAGPEYRALLRRIEASGQTRTAVFQLWYPAVPDRSRPRASRRSPPAAASGRVANYFDLFFRDVALAPQIGAAAQVVLPQAVHLRGGGTLASAAGPVREQAQAEIARRILDAPMGAWVDALPADGRFPLILLAHGLAGNHGMWVTLAEFLASHGYVVAAPTFISDGGLPLVFHDPDSPFARRASQAELQQAYGTILGQIKVVPYFYRLLFGQEGQGFAPPEGFDPATATIVPGGVAAATAMMRNLFRQRVSDLGLVLHSVRLLGMEADSCRASLAAMGATSAARTLCGLLAGRIDGDRVGVAGHSLGAMTAQLAANHLPGVAAALAFNNAPPFSWTPQEMFGSGQTPDGLPAGSRKPLLIAIGDEDDFVQGVFVDLFQSAVAAAGGDPGEAFPLAAERAWPERRDNPQPVALSSWQRALADRVFVIVRDSDHFTLVEDFARMFPWPAFQRGELPFAQTPERHRKRTGQAAFAPPPAGPGEPYAQLGWAEIEGAGAVYLPHLIRDWYALTWFDWHLKGDGQARQRLREGDPFGALTSVRSEIR